MWAERLIIAFILLLLAPAVDLAAHAQESEQEAVAVSPPQEKTPPLGVAEVVPRLSSLTEEAGTALSRVDTLQDHRAVTALLEQERGRQEALQKRLATLGDPAGWSIERLLDIRGRLVEQRNALKGLVDMISQPLAELDRLRTAWEENKTFWQDWEKQVREQKLPLPRDAFAKAGETITTVLEKTNQAFSRLIELQTSVTTLQEKNLNDLNRIEASLDAMRRKTFTRTAPSFFNPAFYRQFKDTLRARVVEGVQESQGISAGYFRDQGWLLLLQAGVALVLGLFIRRQRHTPEVAAEWHFILKHPWATGLFAAISALSFLYPTPSAWWRVSLWFLVVGSASILITGLLENRRKIFTVFFLAALFLVSLLLQTLSLPQPLYRLYLAVVTLLSVPLLLQVARRNRQAKGGRSDLFVLFLQVLSLLFLTAFAAQAGGYSVLASRLFESSLETVFLWLVAAMAIRLVRGGVEYLFSRPLLQRSRFVRRSGDELARRLKSLFDVFVVGYAGFYLCVVWGLVDSVAQAWARLLELGFPWGETFISVQMVLLAALVIYLSIVLSWVLRALLEWEVFPRKGMDRGVRDSIKKLLHYSLVFVGFLLALSLAGIELKNFAVLAGAFGIGIGFGLQNIVNNFVSGIILLFERPIKVGDMVVIENEWGTVRKIGLRSTIVETIDQSEIIVPNSDLVSQKVTNWTLSTKMARVVLPVGVAYGSDLAKVLGLLLAAAEGHEAVVKEPAPSAIFTAFGNSSIDFELRVWIADISRRQVVRSELGQEVDRLFREEGVEIPFPQRDLHLRSLDNSLLDRVAPGRGARNQAMPAEDQSKEPG
ncbi:hypothetical protein JCM30471_26200 [Desulfuromonas carbonis]|uniref:mechanosensitive ion channel family protein n=1 Tax=Desulfuromonas sp. DDH964 TaxID=1823759 RepID=UPI00078C96C4|nr:mechanosensitive ion channel domain-containing protein [Desulfuromonas sp. DDH964]AMV70812.1 small-conductance mechanosensitive ion channel [Desulfuromonas sp. DDH964]